MARPKKVLVPEEAPQPQSEVANLALRIWGGQSVSLSRKERIRRIGVALIGHGYSHEEIASITLPE